jgi:hypothetical protein
MKTAIRSQKKDSFNLSVLTCYKNSSFLNTSWMTCYQNSTLEYTLLAADKNNEAPSASEYLPSTFTSKALLANTVIRNFRITAAAGRNINNDKPEFNSPEFERIKTEAGRHRFYPHHNRAAPLKTVIPACFRRESSRHAGSPIKAFGDDLVCNFTKNSNNAIAWYQADARQQGFTWN